jgi:hypothetical protein
MVQNAIRLVDGISRRRRILSVSNDLHAGIILGIRELFCALALTVPDRPERVD